MKITNYATKCWTKAILEIVLAFVMLFLGVRFFNQIPMMARLFDFFWFSYALFWFGIISLYILAFANIAKSLLIIPPRLTSQDIDAKLKELEEKLRGDWTLAETTLAPPPPPPEDTLPKRRTVAVVLSVVAALMIASLFVGNMALGIGASMGGGSTPEEAFDKFIEKVNAKDFEGAADYTILRFIMSPEEAANMLREMFNDMEDFSVTVNQRYILDEGEIPEELKNTMGSIISKIEHEFGVDIQDWCVIYFNITISKDSGNIEELTDIIPLIKIQGAWYLMFGPGDEGGGETPEEAFDMFIQELNANDFEGAVDYTILKFVMDTQNATERLREIFPLSGEFEILVNFRNVMDDASVPQELKDNMEEIISMIKSEYGMNVEEWCVIEFSITVNIVGQVPRQVSDMIPLIKMDGLWYLMLEPEGGDESSVLSLFDQFVDRMNSHDAQGALVLTVFILANGTVQSSVIGDFNSLWSTGSYHVEVYSKYEKDESEFNASDQNIRDDVVEWLTSEFGLTVDAVCLIYWQGSVYNSTGVYQKSDIMPVVLIGGEWYLVPLKEEGQKVEVKISPLDTGSTMQFVVQYITNASELILSEVYLTVSYANATLSFYRRQLNTMSSGVPENNVTYWDMSDPVRLNPGDYFEFDKYAYQMGSWFELTNADGTMVYLHADFV